MVTVDLGPKAMHRQSQDFMGFEECVKTVKGVKENVGQVNETLYVIREPQRLSCEASKKSHGKFLVVALEASGRSDSF